MIRPSVLVSATAAIAAAAVAIGAASGSSSATPAQTVEGVAHALAEGDVTACDGLTPKARAAIVADASPATDCRAMVQTLDASPGSSTPSPARRTRRRRRTRAAPSSASSSGTRP